MPHIAEIKIFKLISDELLLDGNYLETSVTYQYFTFIQYDSFLPLLLLGKCFTSPNTCSYREVVLN